MAVKDGTRTRRKYRSSQPSLFQLAGESQEDHARAEEVWAQAENLVSREKEVRFDSLKRLEESGAAAQSPLVAYLLYTRLVEPDLALRVRVIQLLQDALRQASPLDPTGAAVSRVIRYHLAEMRTRQIFSLLQAAEFDLACEGAVASLLNACPYGARTLNDILNNRNAPLSVRRMSARLIGMVGYMEALPGLERMVSRLESRMAGQKSMPFAPIRSEDEIELLPEIHQAIRALRAP